MWHSKHVPASSWLAQWLGQPLPLPLPPCDSNFLCTVFSVLWMETCTRSWDVAVVVLLCNLQLSNPHVCTESWPQHHAQLRDHGWDQGCIRSLLGRQSKRNFRQHFPFHENHPQGFTELCVWACVSRDTGHVLPLQPFKNSVNGLPQGVLAALLLEETQLQSITQRRERTWGTWMLFHVPLNSW